MTEPQWTPSANDVARAQITAFAEFVAQRHDVVVNDYQALWQWSLDNLADFWGTLWDYFALGPRSSTVLASATMPGAQWFPGTTVNYVDRVISQAREDRPAILSVEEDGSVVELSWAEMLSRAAGFARSLRNLDVRPGDRVVGYVPNIAVAVIAFLGTASVGAIWSACGQDYSAQAALDRLAQLDPVVLVAADGYTYGGRNHAKLDEVQAIRAGLVNLRATVLVSRLGGDLADAVDWDVATSSPDAVPVTEQVGFEHPLWVLFSSGTTGKPKGIMHGHGGVVVEHLKAVALHCDIGADDTFFWYTSPSWMMWNFQVAGLLVGATIVCYPGSPAAPASDALWELAARTGTTVLGTSPGYALACAKKGHVPRRDHALSRLRLVGVTGSALPAETSRWLGDNVGVPVSSISGGTDIVSAFAGGTPTVPVWPGELSAPYLGVALDAWDAQGLPVRGAVGELVVTAPMPSMPIGFWRDRTGSRYRAAYFETYPGVWRHGDWITRTDHGSVLMHGRSDSTLNRNGIRMGSADIYEAVERLPEVLDALVIGAELPDGGYWMPLFVVLPPSMVLTDELRARIVDTIRTEVSPRHVPDEIIAAPGVPRTRTGKKVEVPIKRILQGAPPREVVDPASIDHPALLDWYAQRSVVRAVGVS
ncbi:acetoacetate--CoA ligase [Nocardia camponoti]|uniref:Acetoacetyl-CoA synthetase n=1 Tax=Nocardia camponoti TaxID=1616106 RepID=A0A917V455_9NOCA|nr:acetoacetate--CoA ligase [Nocardia camponoti]GGK35054.1 acetoacetyl-CoA synthetase [Nocardia camponoti]